jgi:nucleotide-binding universal stress UspA family protein
MTVSTIVLALDESEHAARATRWCAEHAGALGAEVVVVHALDITYVFGFGSPLALAPPPPPYPENRIEEFRDVITRDWCKPLADAGVSYRVVVGEGRPAELVRATASKVHAGLVVCGRRGRGGVAKFLLGSVSHELSHHLDVPLVIVP